MVTVAVIRFFAGYFLAVWPIFTVMIVHDLIQPLLVQSCLIERLAAPAMGQGQLRSEPNVLRLDRGSVRISSQGNCCAVHRQIAA
jgi:hypothetical protein